MGKLVLIEVEELESIIDKSISKHFKSEDQKQLQTENKVLYSIKELSNFLNCSPVTAQKLKNSGAIPFTQYGRKIQFDTAAVLSALEKDKANPRKRK